MRNQTDELISGTALRIAELANGRLQSSSPGAADAQKAFDMVEQAARALSEHPDEWMVAERLRHLISGAAEEVKLNHLGAVHFAAGQHVVGADSLVRSLIRMADDIINAVDRLPGERPELPPQDSSPYHFRVTETHLDVEAQINVVHVADQTNVEYARAHLVDTAERLATGLTNSPQVQAELLVVAGKLRDSSNIIALGIASEAFSYVLSSSSDEIGATHLGTLEAFASSVNSFVSQFPDWQRYAANAAQTNLTNSQVLQAADKLAEIADKFRTQPGLATPAAETAARQMAKLKGGPLGDRVRLAVWATLKNLTLAIVRSVTSEGGKLASRAFIAGLALIALNALKDVPLLASETWAPWAVAYLTRVFGGS